MSKENSASSKASVQIENRIGVEENEILRNKRSIPWVRLQDGLRQSGCPLCNIVERSTHQHLNDLLYEYVLDVSVRKSLHNSFGLCNTHAWLATSVEKELDSDGQHLATLHETVLKAELRLLREAAKTKRSGERRTSKNLLKRKRHDSIVQRVLEVLTPSGECLVCAGARRTEEFYASQCILMFTDNEFRSDYEQNSVLACRPHFEVIMREANSTASVDYFLQQQITKLERLSERVNLFLEKHEVHRRHEPKGSEWTSWTEVLEHFSGKRGIVRLWDSYHTS
jgi:hypothetical protein